MSPSVPLVTRICCLAVFAAAIPGCGGGGPDPARSPETAGDGSAPAAEQRYRRQLGAVCRDLDRRVRALARPRQPAALAGYFERVASMGRAALRRLSAPEPPPRLASRARHVLALAREELGLIAQAALDLRAGREPQETVERLEGALEAVVSREDALWIALGIPDCAEESPDRPSGVI